MLFKDAAKEFMQPNPQTNFTIIRNGIKAGTFLGIHVETERKICMLSKNGVPEPGDYIQDGTGKTFLVKCMKSTEINY